MANRTFNQYALTMEKNVVSLFAKLTFTGASNPTVTRIKGIASITRTAVGTFVITLQDTYPTLLNFSVAFIKTGALAAAPTVILDSETVATTKLLTFKTSSIGTTPALADPASGEVGLVEIQLSNSTAV